VTVRDWLRDCPPAPPELLRTRLDDVLGARGAEPDSRAAAVCVDAAVALLDELLARPSVGRESALDLLATDALVTYAFEAASRDAGAVLGLATDAMRRLGALAERQP
jgi:hypothetical protein